MYILSQGRDLLLFNDYVSTADFLECQMQRGMIVDSISKAVDVAVHTLLEEIAWQVGKSPFTNLSRVTGDLIKF